MSVHVCTKVLLEKPSKYLLTWFLSLNKFPTKVLLEKPSKYLLTWFLSLNKFPIIPNHALV